MNVIIITPSVAADLRKLKANAELNRFSLEQLKTMIANKETPIGDRPGFAMMFPGSGLRMVMSLEAQECGWCWHISVSTPKPGCYPPPAALAEILKELDINPANTVHVDEEKLIEGKTALSFFVLDPRMGPERN